MKLDPTFEVMLTALRIALNAPIIATSVCRCPIHNNNVGGASKSFHLTESAFAEVKGTAAIDIKYSTIEYRNKLARLAWRMGFRIGYHKSFLHLDSAAHCGAKPQSIFKYDVVSELELARFRDMVINN